jgi:DNA processing protein
MDILYEVWLHTVAKFEPDVAAKMLPVFERERHTFTSGEMDEKLLRDIGVSGEFSKRLSMPEMFNEAKELIEYCQDNNIRIITQESEEYPESLKHINLPPRILFAKGAKLWADNRIGVSVVGSRKPTDHGKSFARLIGESLAKNNIAVISGMAEGIDGQAHIGALKAGGYTVAVLAGSVDEVYPRCHERLYREILEGGGTIISERPPKTLTKPYFYQQRNRIIVGLSQGTVIVEGELRSGTSITSNLALEENRDIFAVPSNPMIAQGELPNQLIYDGAVMVHNADVPAKFYKEQYPALVVERKIENTAESISQNLLSDDEKILKYLRENGGIAGAEEISENCNIGINVLNGRLTVLCIKGKLRQESGNRYVLARHT